MSESHPFSPITRARASSHEVVQSGREAVPPRRQGGSTSSDQSSVNKLVCVAIVLCSSVL